MPERHFRSYYVGVRVTTVAERLTAERLAKDAALKYAAKFGDDWDRECGYQDGFTAAYDAQQIEIDRLRALLGEAWEALQALAHHVENCQSYYGETDACASGCPMPLLAKLAQEGLS